MIDFLALTWSNKLLQDLRPWYLTIYAAQNEVLAPLSYARCMSAMHVHDVTTRPAFAKTIMLVLETTKQLSSSVLVGSLGHETDG